MSPPREEHQVSEQGDEFWLRELCAQNGYEYFEGEFLAVQSLELFLCNMPRIPSLKQFPRLMKLCLIGHNISKLKHLSSLPLLEELWICECKIKQIGDLDLLTRLTRLYLYANEIRKIENLQNLSKLQVLWLNNNEIKIIEGITHLKSLRELNLSENRISSIGDSLEKNLELETLDISGNKLMSFNDISVLRELPNLKVLGLKDPMYEPNPVSILCNYSTHLLYYLPNLTMLDSYDVSQKALKDLAESIVLKKRMFYKMRKKVLERKMTEICHALTSEKKRLQAKPEDMIRKVTFAIKEIEKDLKENEALYMEISQRSAISKDEEKSSPSEETAFDEENLLQRSKGLQVKHEALKERKMFWEKKFRGMEIDWNEAGSYAKDLSRKGSRRLSVEFETGGNVKFEEGTPSDVWYTSCKDLVLARFSVSDLKDFEVTGLRIHKIIRVQNRHLKQKFDDAYEEMLEQYDDISQNARKYLDYLFYSSRPSNADTKVDQTSVASEGFSQVSTKQKSILGNTIALTNSVGLADKRRIKAFVKNKSKGDATKCSFRYGQLLICKTFIGKSAQLASDKKVAQSAYPDYHSVYRPRRHVSCPTLSSKVRSSSASSSNVFCDCTARKCTWYIFESCFVLPEYLVEFEYLTKTTPPLILSLRQLILADHEKPVYDQAFASDIDELEAIAADANLIQTDPIVQSRPRLTILSDELLLKHAKVSFLSKIVELNLNGSGLTRLKPVSSLQNLKKLIVSFNDLVTLSDLSGLSSLEYLDASFNAITTLEGCKVCDRYIFGVLMVPDVLDYNVQGCTQLSYLDVSWNKLHYTREEVGLLRNNFPNIKVLLLAWNNWLKPQTLRLRCIGRLKNLTEFNGTSVTEEEAAVAFQLVTCSRISNAAILANSTADTSPSRTLGLTSETDTLISISRLKPSVLQEDDKQWYYKVTCMSLNSQHLSKISNLERLCNLRWASFDDNAITKIEGLESCGQLEELSLSGNCITKLEGIAHLSKLRSLDVSHNRITQVDNAHLISLKELSSLDMEDNILSTFKGLKDLTSLHELYVGNNNVSSLREIFHLKNSQSLVILDLHGNEISEGKENYRLFVVYHMGTIKALDGITVDSSEISQAKDMFGGRLTHDFVAEKLGQHVFSELMQLDLPNCNLRSIDLGNGEAFPQLRSINLEHNNLTSFGGLIFLMNLRVLCLNYNHIESIIAKPKSNSGQISPQKSASDIREECCSKSFVAVLEKLEVLHLAYNSISSISALQLERLPSIKALFLQGNNISKVDGLEGLNQLRELVLDKNKIKAICETSFANQWKLTELHIEENRLKSFSGLEPLANLRRLYVGMNRIQDMTEIDKLEGLTSLIELSLIGNPVSKKMAHRPALVFRQPHLLSIDGVPVTSEERAKAELCFLEQQGSLQAVQALMENIDSSLPSYSSSKAQPPLKVTTMPLNGSYLDQYLDIGARLTGFEVGRTITPQGNQEYQELARGINQGSRRNGNQNSRSNTVSYIPHVAQLDMRSRKPPKR